MEIRNKIFTGDTLATLKTFPDECVDCIVTSPPYYGLRQYLFDGAVIPRYNLSNEQKEWLEKDLRGRGILPRQTNGQILKGSPLATPRLLS